MFDAFLGRLSETGRRGLIVDEAHSLPPATDEQVIEIASLRANRDTSLQFVLAGQPAVGGAPMMPKPLDRSHRRSAPGCCRSSATNASATSFIAWPSPAATP